MWISDIVLCTFLNFQLQPIGASDSIATVEYSAHRVAHARTQGDLQGAIIQMFTHEYKQARPNNQMATLVVTAGRESVKTN